jgi:hypothetical protein
MDVDISCAICGFEVSGTEIDGPGAEHLMNLYAARHPEHTERQVNSYIWANGNHPVVEPRRRKDADE